MGRFKRLVDSEEGMKEFRAKYRIPPSVGVRYVAQGEWVDDRKTRDVVIPMIAFIEGGMTILMGVLTRNFLRFFRLSPTQCALNMFKDLGSTEVLNERMNLNLTHHDVNWIYNLHHMKGQGYYLKSRYPEVRLIQYLLTLNKGLNEDFLIFSGGWHDGLPCPTKEEKPGRDPTVNLYALVCVSLSFPPISVLIEVPFFFNDFANNRSTKPMLSLVNRVSLDRILQSEVYVNETNDQLRAVHLILGYTPFPMHSKPPSV